MEFNLVLTNKCQLNCLHCFTSSSPSKKDVMPVDMFKIVMEKCVEMVERMRIKEKEAIIVTLSGGEVTLLGAKYLSQIVSIVRKTFEKKNMSVSISLISNLLSFNREVESLVRAEDISLSFSFDPEIRILQGSHAKFVSLWEKQYLKARERGINPTIALTITKQLIKWDIWRFIDRMAVDTICLQTLMPVGRARENLSIIGPTLSETSDYIINILKDRSKSNLKKIYSYDLLKEEYKKYKETSIGGADCWQNCQQSFYINYDGEIGSCGLCVPLYGNIFTDSVDKILMSPPRIQHSMAKTPYLHSECRGCDYEDFCRHGCQGLKKMPSGGECHGLKRVLDYCIQQ